MVDRIEQTIRRYWAVITTVAGIALAVGIMVYTVAKDFHKDQEGQSSRISENAAAIRELRAVFEIRCQ